MRVLISAYSCDPQGGSEGANAWYTAEGLARSGADVHILTRLLDQPNTQAGIEEYAANPGAGLLSASYLPDSVPSRLNSGQVGVYARYAAWQMRCHRWAKDPGNGPWDIGHHVSWGSLSHPIGLSGCGFPFVVGPIGGGQYLHPEHERWFDGDPTHDRRRATALRHLVPMNPVARHAARTASLVLVTNNETAALAKRLGARRVDLSLAEGVRPGQLRDRVAFPEAASIVWIGRFLPLKAASLALAAFRSVLAAETGARLTFIGDGPTRPSVESQAGDLVRGGYVRFTGRLPWAEAQQELAAARLHLFTSVRDSSSAQTLEAAALGVPTVALDMAGCRAFLHRPGFRLVDPLPGEGLDNRVADQTLQVLRMNADEWLAQSAGARRFAAEQQFRQRTAATKMEYERVLHDGSH